MSELSVNSMLLLSVLITAVMNIISITVYLTDRQKRHLITVEFWISYASYFLVSYITQGLSPHLVALSTLTWIWRTRTIRLILEGISRENLYRKWHTIITGASFALGGLLAFVGASFEVFTLPMSLSIFCIGVDYLYSTWLSIQGRKMSSLHYLLIVNVGIIFVHILDYPFLRYNHEYTALGFGIVLSTTILMAILIPAVTIYELQRDYHHKLENLVHERTGQLVTQSKMSALGEMSSGMAHEINNPLSIISGRASQLKRAFKRGDASKETLLKGLEQIEQTGERITKIIKGLQDFSRDTKADKMSPISLDELIKETLFLCQERFHDHGVRLIINNVPELTIECRHIQITQVLVNLLNNAFDATMELQERWVKLDFKNDDTEIEIRVTDSGRGIAEDIRSKMMQPFFTTKEVGKGTGLGLAISRGIIEDHQGNFFYDTPSPHTCFVIRLPKLSVRKDMKIHEQFLG
jgi:signal transduction histidine kinase